MSSFDKKTTKNKQKGAQRKLLNLKLFRNLATLYFD